MKLLLKVILILFAIFLIFIAILAIITAVNTSFIDTVFDYAQKIVEINYFSTVFLVLAALIFTTAAVMMIMISSKSRPKETYVVTATEMGEVRISFETVKNIVFNSLSYIDELRDTRIILSKNENGLGISVSAQVCPDIVIPDLASRMQIEVKNAVEKSTGVPVNDVRVNVDRIFSEEKRIEKSEKNNI